MAVKIGVPEHEVKGLREYRSEFTWSPRELRRAARVAGQCRLGWLWRLGMKLVGIPLSLVCLLGLSILLNGPEHEFRGMFMAMYGLFLLIGLGLVFHGGLFVWLNCRRPEVRCRIGERVVSLVTCGGIRSGCLGTDDLISWRAFRRLGVSRHGVLLVMEGGLVHWLPRESFPSSSDWLAVRELAKRHVH